MTLPEIYLPSQPIPFVVEDNPLAEKIAFDIDDLLDGIKKNEETVAQRYVLLGDLLFQVRANRYWKTYGFENFGAYISSIKGRIEKGRSQIYMCISVVSKLLPLMSQDDLQKIGISKATELKKFVQDTNKVIPDDILEIARDPKKTRRDLRAAIAKTENRPLQEKEAWYDFGGTFFSDEEKTLWEQAVKSAKHTDPVVSHDIPEHIQRKIVCLRFAEEYLSTYPLEAQ